MFHFSLSLSYGKIHPYDSMTNDYTSTHHARMDEREIHIAPCYTAPTKEKEFHFFSSSPVCAVCWVLRTKTFTHLILAMNLNDAHISHLACLSLISHMGRNENKIHVKNALTTYKKICVKCDVNVIEILRNALRCYRMEEAMRAKHK